MNFSCVYKIVALHLIFSLSIALKGESIGKIITIAFKIGKERHSASPIVIFGSVKTIDRAIKKKVKKNKKSNTFLENNFGAEFPIFLEIYQIESD